MENHQERESFTYTYSAKEHAEVQHIRSKYLPRTEDKLEQLRRLDRSVTQKGTVAALIAGILGTLILGTGMCCVLVWQGIWFIPGIFIGFLGMAIAACAYPLYSHITQKQRQKIAPEILQLTDELLQ